MSEAAAHPYASPAITPVELPTQAVKRKGSSSSGSFEKEHDTEAAAVAHSNEYDELEEERLAEEKWAKRKPFVYIALGIVILGWWISATVLPATRHRWIVQTVWAWFFLFIIIFRFVPTTVVSRPVEAIWVPLIQTPFSKLPRLVRLGLGWLALLGLVFGSAFGFPLEANSKYGDRAISVLGLFIFQFGFFATSSHRKDIPWPTVIVGLFIQQAVALFVLKSGAGFSIFKWIAIAASDFLDQGLQGSTFFFGADLVSEHLFFVNTLPTIIFFIAFVQMMYYLGVMQWLIGNFAWLFFKLMNVSGAEAVVAAASPFIGQGESACLVKPYVDLMTTSELHLVMTSGFSTISGSLLGAYIGLGVPAQNLITSSVMSIPSSIAISKMRMPELEEPLTRGSIVVDRGAEDKEKPANSLHAFSNGAWFGLMVAAQIFCNVATVISLVALINGLLTWIGRGFGIHALTLQLFLGYIFYPVTFLLGVPRAEILRVSSLLGTKIVANEFVAYLDLQAIMQSDSPLSPRAFTIASYSLCGFANLGSVGIQIGVLGALAPSKSKVIARIAFSAMICGFISTIQSAGIAGMLV